MSYNTCDTSPTRLNGVRLSVAAAPGGNMHLPTPKWEDIKVTQGSLFIYSNVHPQAVLNPLLLLVTVRLSPAHSWERTAA